MDTTALCITFDGASRGNPGPGSSAAVLWRGAERIADKAFRHPRHVTNNEAEYGGLLAGLELAKEARGARLTVEGDSKLVIEHVFGKWKCKCPRLVPLQRRARELVAEIKAAGASVEGRWIPRERNGAADALCNKVLDSSGTSTSPFTATPPITKDTPWPAPKRDTPTPTIPRPQAARRRTILEQLAM
jgi:probable phosphoglycerate mutase